MVVGLEVGCWAGGRVVVGLEIGCWPGGGVVVGLKIGLYGNQHQTRQLCKRDFF